MSSRLAAASNSLFVTTHGGSIPSAIRNNSVSRIASTSSGAAALRPSWLGGGAPPTPPDFKHQDTPPSAGDLCWGGPAGGGEAAARDEGPGRARAGPFFL